MEEKIGNVVLDYTFYKGTDQYSDGDIEDVLLSLIEKEPDVNEIIRSDKRWPVLYHFSPIRQNIVEWYPFKPDASVLEIGAGCGAVTGGLAKKAKSVTCVDLSKRRSLINANRNKDCDNVRIMVGNFNDIVLEEKFDYITLIGVMEYAAYYTEGADPFRGFLTNIAKLLKPDGRVLIAIENKFGMKYWAGCREDHTGGFFDGLEGYHQTDSRVRTFGKEELRAIFESAGYSSVEFYYPFPDYKFPQQIFSDDYLPKAEDLVCSLETYDADRLQLFDETSVFRSVVNEGKFDFFSNSYFVEIAKAREEISEPEKAFSKFTRERDERFQIETAIYQYEGKKFAVKRPLTEKASSHVAALYENYKYFCDKGVQLFTECEPFADGVSFAFVDGVTYYNLLLEAVEAGDRERFDEILARYKAIVEESCPEDGEAFETSPEFEAVFGAHSSLAGKTAYKKLDIDLTLDNLILTGDGKNRIIDYEWMFDFPVPLDFMYYRAALALYVRNGAGMNAFISESDLFGKFGLTQEDMEVYREMNEAFNAYTAGGEHSLAKTLKGYAKKSYDLSEWVKQSYGLVQVFISEDDTFRYAECLDYVLGAEAEYADLTIDLKKYDKLHVIRLDPLNMQGTISNLRITYTQNGQEYEVEPLALRHNAVMVYGGSYVFTEEDPQIIWDIPADKKPEILHITYGIGHAKDGMKIMKTQLEDLEAKEKKLAYIEGTSAYRMFLEKKVGKVFGGKN